MTCYTPLKAYRTRSADGDYSITFNPNNPDLCNEIILNCGQCIGCRLERSRQWAVRCLHEAEMHEHNAFVTLTFDDEHYNQSLRKSDFQNFMKRLRKKLKQKIRYFHCGEYGENYERAHHHACLFGINLPDLILFKKTENGDSLYTSEILSSIWGKGFCYIGEVTFESAAYVARYIIKKVSNEKTYDGKIPEYTTQSRRPGIGTTWIEKYIKDVYPLNEVIIKGKKMKPPRFYDKYYEKMFPNEYMHLKTEKENIAYELKDNLDNKPERLIVRHELQIEKQKKIKRNYETQSHEDQNQRLKNYDNKVVNKYKEKYK